MFSLVECIYPSLVFASKAAPYPNEAPFSAPLSKQEPTLLQVRPWGSIHKTSYDHLTIIIKVAVDYVKKRLGLGDMSKIYLS